MAVINKKQIRSSNLPLGGIVQILVQWKARASLFLVGLVICFMGFNKQSTPDHDAIDMLSTFKNTTHVKSSNRNPPPNNQLRTTVPNDGDQDVIQPFQYTISKEIVPKKRVLVLKRKPDKFRAEKITTKDGRESYISTESFKEMGDEIRYLLERGRGELLPNGKEPQVLQQSLSWRKRLHARAPWLKGNPEDSNWPLSTLPKPVDGKAILVCAGNPQMPYLKNLIHSIRVIHKSSMPIRVVYRDANDLSAQSRSDLFSFLPEGTDYNLQLIDLSEIFNLDAANLKAGWYLKPLGFLAVAETEVALLDVDNILLQRPERLFESSRYRDVGASFFHDRFFTTKYNGWFDPAFLAEAFQPNLSATAKAAIRYRDKPYIGEHVMESGVVVIDKTRRVLGIWATCLIAAREDIRQYTEIFYAYGDKELYWIGFETISEPYTFGRYLPGIYGAVVTNYDKVAIAIKPKDDVEEARKRLKEANDNGYALCGRVLHFDDENLPLWSNGGYFTKEEDWKSTSDLAEFPLNAIWFIDGGDFSSEHFLPSMDGVEIDSKRGEYVDPEGKAILTQAKADWEEAKAKGKMNQHWKTHGGMGVMCLHPNARGIRETPKEIAEIATNAARRFFLEERGMHDKYGDLW